MQGLKNISYSSFWTESLFLFFSLPVDITMAVFVIGARTPEGWDFLFQKYRQSLQMSVKSRMKTAMAVSPLQDKLKWCAYYIPLLQAFERFHLYFVLPFLYPYFCRQDDGAEPPWWGDEDSGPPGRGRLRQQEPPWLQIGLGLPPSQLAHPDQEVSQPHHAHPIHSSLHTFWQHICDIYC